MAEPTTMMMIVMMLGNKIAHHIFFHVYVMTLNSDDRGEQGIGLSHS